MLKCAGPLKPRTSRCRGKTPAPSPPPPAPSVPPSQPDALSLMQCQVDTLNAMLNSMSETFFCLGWTPFRRP